jgi:hypothetical protein
MSQRIRAAVGDTDADGEECGHDGAQITGQEIDGLRVAVQWAGDILARAA